MEGLTLNPPPDSKKFNDFLRNTVCKYPPGYLEFMQEHNGAEGLVLDAKPLLLYSFEELQDSNKTFRTEENAPDLLIVGSNGGIDAICIHRVNGTFINVPFADLETNEYREDVGATFVEFLAYCSLPYEDDNE